MFTCPNIPHIDHFEGPGNRFVTLGTSRSPSATISNTSRGNRLTSLSWVLPWLGDHSEKSTLAPIRETCLFFALWGLGRMGAKVSDWR